MRFYDPLTPNPSPAWRERGDAQRRGEGLRRSDQTIRQAARQLRREMTKSEQLLWECLRNRSLAGRKFRRQHPIGRFILDFYCPEARLAIEIDGSVHQARRHADLERQKILEADGIRFVRVPAAIVERDLGAALETIKMALTGSSSARRERGGLPKAGRGEG